MALAQTQAAAYLQEHSEQISSHQVISLLLHGAIERGQQAQQLLKLEQQDLLETLLHKLIAIINGLKNSLDLSAGEIAENLDALYEYMIERITLSPSDQMSAVLEEVENLLTEVKSGWDQMDLSSVEFVRA